MGVVSGGLFTASAMEPDRGCLPIEGQGWPSICFMVVPSCILALGIAARFLPERALDVGADRLGRVGPLPEWPLGGAPGGWWPALDETFALVGLIAACAVPAAWRVGPASAVAHAVALPPGGGAP